MLTNNGDWFEDYSLDTVVVPDAYLTRVSRAVNAVEKYFGGNEIFSKRR